MRSSSDVKTNSRIEFIRKRQAALRDQLAQELVRHGKKRAQEQPRLCSIIGAALVESAATHPDFELMLKSVLQTATSLGDSDKKLLREKGWL
jgi:hypothetical protein